MAHQVYLFLLILGLFSYGVIGARNRDDESEPAPDEQEPGDVSEPTAEDDEIDDPMSESSGAIDTEPQDDVPTEAPTLYDRMRWVTFAKIRGTAREATIQEAGDVVRRYRLQNSLKNSVDCKSGMELKSPMGILYEDEDDYTEPHLVESHNQTSFKPLDTSQYPGFATGLLKSKNCTAFLIGKVSALTLADCVYDSTSGRWNEDLDLWRGRNCNTYIGHMKWESVTIPHQYYVNGNVKYNWAYIKYKHSTASNNWIGLSYDSYLEERTDVHVTLNGYPREKSSGCPFQSPCLLLGKTGQLYCPLPSPYTFPGGPLVAAPSTPANVHHTIIGNSPRLYGIASRTVLPSLNEVTTISEEMFWLVYDLMSNFHDKPDCDLHRQQDWFFINRVVKQE